jgi:hypothetical protein
VGSVPSLESPTAKLSSGRTRRSRRSGTSASGGSRLRELLDPKSMRKLGLNGNRQKVVQVGEVKRFIEERWEYLSTLP